MMASSLLWLTSKFELSRGGQGDNLRSMEGLRGFAVFLVFLVHYATLVRPWLSGSTSLSLLATALHTIGNTGVDLFFVLSGYLIYGTQISKEQAFGKFMRRRIQRLYPAFTAVFALYVALSFVFPAENKIPSSLLAGSIYLLQNFLLLPGIFPVEPMITVAWSLSYEMLYYLAVPAVIALTELRGRSWSWRLAFFVAVTAAIASYCAANGGPIRLIMFISGILLYESVNARYMPALNGHIGLVALVAGLAAMLLPISLVPKIVALFASFYILCLTCFQDSANWLTRLFSWTPVRWLGNMSYSYYLLHGLALKAGFLALSRIHPAATASDPELFWLLLPVMFAITLVPTTLLFLVIERPFSLVPERAKEKTVLAGNYSN